MRRSAPAAREARGERAGVADAAADAGEQRHAAGDQLGDGMHHRSASAVVRP